MSCLPVDRGDFRRENSPVTQTTPEPTLLSWGGWPRGKIFPHPWPRCQTRSYHAYQATQTPLFSNPWMLPFDTQLCQICLRFHQILKLILEMAFSAHFSQIWKLNQISVTIISKVAHETAFDAAACSSDAWPPPPLEFAGGGIFCNGARKHGHDSHAAMFSLCVPKWCAPAILDNGTDIDDAWHNFLGWHKKITQRWYCA